MRVVVADDSVLFREGIARLLEDAGWEVVGHAGDADDLLRKVRAHNPDAAVVDIRMPPGNADDGIRAALEIREELPGTGVLVLSQYVEEGYALELVATTAEGVGYLLKDRVADVERFTDSVRRVADGGSASTPRSCRSCSAQRAPGPLEALTRARARGAGADGGGSLEQAIADQLVITVRAVEKHVNSIFSKLELHRPIGSPARAAS